MLLGNPAKAAVFAGGGFVVNAVDLDVLDGVAEGAATTVAGNGVLVSLSGGDLVDEELRVTALGVVHHTGDLGRLGVHLVCAELHEVLGLEANSPRHGHAL